VSARTLGRASGVVFDGVPRAGLLDSARGLQAHFRPGAHRGPLRRLGERCVVDVPGAPPLLITSSPDDAKAILANRDGVLSLGRALHRTTPHPVLFGDDSLIFLEGAEHVQERRRLAPPFHGQMMRSFEPTIEAIARRRADSWSTEEPVEFVELAQDFVLDVMRSIIFGVAKGERMRRLDAAMRRYCAIAESDGFLATGILGVLLTGRWRGYPPLDRAARAVDEIVLEEIAERRVRGSEGRDDCLTLFLAVNDEEEHPKDDATLARDMRGLMLAGYETTAITLGWIVEMLAHRPEATARAEASVDAGELAYLDAVITEVMRLRPTFPFTGRRAVRDFSLDGVRIPKGALVVISIMAVHERDDLYDDPMAFRPERFLGQRAGTYSWLSFGGGPHRCIGASLAVFVSRVLLRTLLERRRLRPADPRPERARRTHPMLIPEHGGKVFLAPR
jgi:cytochrome P450